MSVHTYLKSVLESDLNRILSSYRASHLSDLNSDLVERPVPDFAVMEFMDIVVLIYCWNQIVPNSIVVVKKKFRYSNGFFYNHLYHPELFYEKRYNAPTRSTGYNGKYHATR